MSRFEVDSAHVVQTSAAVQATAVAIGEQLTRMDRHVAELQASWQGQAAASFTAVAADWRAVADRTRQSLESISLALQHAGQQYADVEAATARMFSG